MLSSAVSPCNTATVPRSPLSDNREKQHRAIRCPPLRCNKARDYHHCIAVFTHKGQAVPTPEVPSAQAVLAVRLGHSSTASAQQSQQSLYALPRWYDVRLLSFREPDKLLHTQNVTCTKV